jgi:UDP-N-acetylenolpyruvoylglucosamine reductase
MLIGRIQAEVREKFGIPLVREVRIVGVARQDGEGV